MVSHGSLDDSAQPLAGGHERLLDFAGGWRPRRTSERQAPQLAVRRAAAQRVRAARRDLPDVVREQGDDAGRVDNAARRSHRAMARQLAGQASHRGREQEPSGMAPDSAA